MPELMVSLLETIRLMGDKVDKTKQEKLTYDDLLRYASSLARYNTLCCDRQYRRLDDEDMADERTGGYSTKGS